MNFRDRGIIISKRELKERSSIVTIFSENNGIYSGVSKQFSKKDNCNLLEGNLVDFCWSARLHEHIGSFKIEPVESYNAHIIMDKTKLYAFNSIVAILKMAFCEREPHNNLFPTLLSFLQELKSEFSIKKYMELEIDILAEAGYKMQLQECVASGKKEELCYVSPKSACAVSKQAGEQYKDKLLKLPKFLIRDYQKTMGDIQIDDLRSAFDLTSYFLDRYIFINKPSPDARLTFREHVLS
ncbi:DNA repair protein RecO [Rickettsiaceae bacterium]|nr:DNA repair protein RecO [Rickettsiaceae bacterium]